MGHDEVPVSWEAFRPALSAGTATVSGLATANPRRAAARGLAATNPAGVAAAATRAEDAG